MADKGNGSWALRNAKPQNIDTGNRCEWIVAKNSPDKGYRLEMDKKGVFMINATGLNTSDEFHRMNGERIGQTLILNAYTDMEGNKLEANKKYDKITKDGKIFKVLEVSEVFDPRWRIREYTPLSKTQILSEFSDRSGRKLQKGKDYRYIVKDGIEYHVHTIEREEQQERWEISKSAVKELNTTQRRISAKELEADFMNSDSTPLDIDAIRKNLGKSFDNVRF